MRGARLPRELCISAAVRNKLKAGEIVPPFQRGCLHFVLYFARVYKRRAVLSVFASQYTCVNASAFVCASAHSIRASECVRMRRATEVVSKQMYSHTHALLITQPAPPPSSPLCLSSGPIPPFFPSHPPLPPMCPRCPNPFPGRKALIEGAGFSLWPVGAHYCVFISK